MSAEWIAVVITGIGAGAGITVAVVSGFRRINDTLKSQGERLARIEGMIDTLQSVMLADRGFEHMSPTAPTRRIEPAGRPRRQR